MLTPDEIAALREYSLLLTQPVNDFLLKDIARRVAKAGQLTSTAEYQMCRAQFLGADMPKLKENIETLVSEAGLQIDNLFEFVESKSLDFAENRQLQQITAAYLKASKKDLETLLKTKNIGFVAPDGHVYPLQNAYLKTMDYAVRQVITGAADYNTAIRQATKRLADSGIRTLPQKNGRNIGIEYAVRRYVMNNISAVATNINEANHDAMGADGWELSAHAASAPDHEPFQGQQFTDKEYSELNNSLVRRIGTLSCKHIAYPIILGISRPAHSEAELKRYVKENADGITYQGQHYTLYQAEQIQRGIENEIRRQKNKSLIAKNLGDKESLQSAQIKLNILKDEYNRFSIAAGLRTSSARMQVAGFGRSEASKASAAYRKNTANNKAYSDREFSIKAVTEEIIEAVPKIYGIRFSEAQAINLQNAHKALLVAAQNKEIGTEAGVYLNKDMNQTTSFVFGKIGKIRMPDSTSDAKAMIHNHPSGETFSLNDISLFTTDENLDILTAIGNDGSLYMLEKTEEYNFSEIQHLYIQAALENPTSIEELPKIIKEREVLFDDFRRYGLNYTTIRNT